MNAHSKPPDCIDKGNNDNFLWVEFSCGNGRAKYQTAIIINNYL